MTADMADHRRLISGTGKLPKITFKCPLNNAKALKAPNYRNKTATVMIITSVRFVANN